MLREDFIENNEELCTEMTVLLTVRHTTQVHWSCSAMVSGNNQPRHLDHSFINQLVL